ncbi:MULTISPECIES: amino acid ABC transporter permease [unclassified Paenibacillus]|uniref:amino acid ABC transporter permease n=1 Tax=unclassified Paenibacillus TaxID=185978 RepID=UPI0024B99869|nr:MULTISPECIES: amino acid ABC transporter permease [unclassified Paenibacillus]
MPNLFDFGVVMDMIPQLIKYIPITFEIVLLSVVFSWLIGFVVALVKINKVPVLYPLSGLYVSFMRGTPLIIQLYIAYFGIPLLLQYWSHAQGVEYSVNGINPIVFVVVAFALNEGAYCSETIRAGLEAVDKGQTEAAMSIGMTASQTFFKIVLPEALIVALPSLGNAFIGMIKNTSLAFTCAVVELTAGARLLASKNYRFFESYVALAIIYWIITIVAARLIRVAENKLRANERQVDFNDTSS